MATILTREHANEILDEVLYPKVEGIEEGYRFMADGREWVVYCVSEPFYYSVWASKLSIMQEDPDRAESKGFRKHYTRMFTAFEIQQGTRDRDKITAAALDRAVEIYKAEIAANDEKNGADCA